MKPALLPLCLPPYILLHAHAFPYGPRPDMRHAAFARDLVYATKQCLHNPLGAMRSHARIAESRTKLERGALDAVRHEAGNSLVRHAGVGTRCDALQTAPVYEGLRAHEFGCTGPHHRARPAGHNRKMIPNLLICTEPPRAPVSEGEETSKRCDAASSLMKPSNACTL